MAKRRALSKRVRFEVFKRDSFTCQYCGRKPPEVILEVDHIDPVCEGGTSEDINLTTACEGCNRGKAGKPLGSFVPSPDAQQAYLQAQQEISEMRQYIIAKQERDALSESIVESLSDVWMDAMPGWVRVPEPSTFRSMMAITEPENIESAIWTTGRAVRTNHVAHFSAVSYVFGIIRRMEKSGDGE